MKIEDFCENFFRKIVLYIIPLRGLRNEYITRKKSREVIVILCFIIRNIYLDLILVSGTGSPNSLEFPK